MFFVGHRLKAQILFPPHELHELNAGHFLMTRMKELFQGRCVEEYGFLVQILPMKGEQKGGVKLGQIKVAQKGCLAMITFDCLCFKPQKGDIFDVSVHYVDRQIVRGKLGGAQILISGHKMGGMEYNPKTNTYSARICNGSRVNVDIGSKVRCRCLQWIAQEKAMKIICEVDQLLLDSIAFGQY